VIYCTTIFNKIVNIKDELRSASNASIEHILEQIPSMQYDGKSLYIKSEDGVADPYYIYDINNQKFAAIASISNSVNNDKVRIPLVFLKNKFILSVLAFDGISKKREDISIDYPSLLGSDPWIVNQETLRSYLIDSLEYVGRIFIYIAMPIICLMRFVGVFLARMFVILLIYVVSYFIGIKMSIEESCRLIMFASGPIILIQPIILSIIPELSFIIPVFQIVPGLIMVLAISKTKYS
jgi:hypothetical protein